MPFKEQRQQFSSLYLQVLRALDRARSTIGFRHGDMHIRNVMEHRIEDESGGPDLETDKVSFRVR